MLGISIALATHNGEKYLPLQLQSLAAQRALPVEVVVSDDCSTDRTADIVEAFATRAPFPVNLIRGKRRLGFRDNFMRAAQNCKAELIAFCDQDDVWEADKTDVMRRPFDDPSVLLAYHNATLTAANGSTIGRFYRGKVTDVVHEPLTRHPWVVIPGFMQVFRRELLDFSALHLESYDVDWPGHPLAHDRWFVFLASVFGRIAYVNQPLVRYRQHDSNVYGFYPDERAHFDRLASGIRFIRAAVSASNNRGKLLRKMQDQQTPALPPPWRDRSREAIAYYGVMSRELEARKAVYMAHSYGARARALYALVRRGAYGRLRKTTHFTGWDLLLDFYLAAPLGPRLRRLLRK